MGVPFWHFLMGTESTPSSAKQMIISSFPLTRWAFGSWFVCLGGGRSQDLFGLRKKANYCFQTICTASTWKAIENHWIMKAGRAWRSSCLHSLFYRWGNGGPEWGGTFPVTQWDDIPISQRGTWERVLPQVATAGMGRDMAWAGDPQIWVQVPQLSFSTGSSWESHSLPKPQFPLG